jgi:hypothetical protein
MRVYSQITRKMIGSTGTLRAARRAEALRSICDLDLSDLEQIEPPRGFGRD